jgi:hypothetical protein
MLIGGAAEGVLGLVRLKGLHLEKILPSFRASSDSSPSSRFVAACLSACSLRDIRCATPSQFDVARTDDDMERIVGVAKGLVLWHATQLI